MENITLITVCIMFCLRIFYGHWSSTTLSAPILSSSLLYSCITSLFSGFQFNICIIVVFHFLIFPVLIYCNFKVFDWFCWYCFLWKVVPNINYPVAEVIFLLLILQLSFLNFFLCPLVCSTSLNSTSLIHVLGCLRIFYGRWSSTTLSASILSSSLCIIV